MRHSIPIFCAVRHLDIPSHADHTNLKLASDAPIDYPKPDNIVSFDRNSSFIYREQSQENQPPSAAKDSQVPIEHNLALYDAPEQRYCPAGVYEIVREEDGSHPRLQINAQIAFTVRLVILRIPLKIFGGSPRKAAAVQITRICKRIKASWLFGQGHWILYYHQSSVGFLCFTAYTCRKEIKK